jgi:hypothetical protein
LFSHNVIAYCMDSQLVWIHWTSLFTQVRNNSPMSTFSMPIKILMKPPNEIHSAQQIHDLRGSV